MNILVCIKQVPDTTEIRIDPKTHTLIRDGVDNIVNLYDIYALEAAARIKDENADVTISVLSMGPKSAESALRDCLAIAADEAWLVSGREFAGSDTMATAYALSVAVRRIEEIRGERFDAVFCGKQAIDGDTAQVGPALAEMLGVCHASNINEANYAEDAVRVCRESNIGTEIIELEVPCLLTFTKPSYIPRVASLGRRMAARKAEIKSLGADDLPDLDRSRIGLKGSPTRVVSTYVPEAGRRGIKIEGSFGEIGEKLARVIKDAKEEKHV